MISSDNHLYPDAFPEVRKPPSPPERDHVAVATELPALPGRDNTASVCGNRGKCPACEQAIMSPKRRAAASNGRAHYPTAQPFAAPRPRQAMPQHNRMVPNPGDRRRSALVLAPLIGWVVFGMMRTAETVAQGEPPPEKIHDDILPTGTQPGTKKPTSSKERAPQTEPPKVEPPKTEPPMVEPPKVESPKVEPPKTEPPKLEPPKVEPPKVEPPKTEPPKVEPPKTEPPKAEAAQGRAATQARPCTGGVAASGTAPAARWPGRLFRCCPNPT